MYIKFSLKSNTVLQNYADVYDICLYDNSFKVEQN